jgi:predicted TIM-barrel fold metal-dependent hydrolase
MVRIDCHSHIFPPAYAELFKRNSKPTRATGGDGVYTITYNGGVQTFRLDLADYSPQRKLQEMDRSGVDAAVLSVNIPTPDLLESGLALEGARICNDALAELAAHYPDRFVGLASLPLPDVAAAIVELDRALDELGLRGVFLPSHIDGKPLDLPELEPFYRHVEARQTPLVLHPSVPVWAEVIKEHSMIPMLGFMVDSSIGMLRLILGGVLERYPRLKIVQPHAGGVLPYLMGRIEEQTEVKRRGREHITRPPGDYYRQIYLDMVSPSSLALRYLCEFAAPDRLLFGSDHPWISMASLLELVDQLDIPESHRIKILGLNAGELFSIGQ